MSLMALMAAACSSDEIVAPEGGNQDGGNNTTEGTAYVGLNITLPSTNGNGNRAEDYDYNPGKPDEYKVNDLKITFYYSDSEGNPTKQDVVYDINDISWQKTGETGITAKALLPVTQVKFNGEAQALVEINNKGLDVNVEDYSTVVSDKTVKDFIGIDKNDFFMTNTVREDGKYLVTVKSYPTKLEAQTNASKYVIRVERAVAKVEVKTTGTGTGWQADGSFTIQGTLSDNIFAGANVSFQSWQLDVTNKKTFPVRHFAGTGTYADDDAAYGRFYDFLAANTYRTGWAEDPNYTGYTWSIANENANFNRVPSVGEINNQLNTGVEYCFENTFDVTNQKQDETTRVLVKAKFVPSGITLTTEEPDWFTLGNSTKAYTKSGVEAQIAQVLNIADPTTVAYNIGSITAGTKELERTDIKIGTDYISTTDLAIVKNALGKVTKYKNGNCYYGIRIKHMANYCPWGEAESGPAIGGTKFVDYTAGTDEMRKAYLGRYGVVRNNWYKVTINSVTQPGSPVLPELTTNPDDEQYYYLQANISIEDWAVREQGVTL